MRITVAESEELLRKFLSPRLFEAGLICRVDDRGVLGDDRLQAQALERVVDAAEVAPPVIDDRDHSDPFVEGTTPAMRGSSRVAWATARATALKTASAMWCRLSP